MTSCCHVTAGWHVQEAREGLAKVQNFLEQVALWSEPEKYAVDGDEDGAPDVVNVLTLHLSKGLEYNAVFIVGEPIVPSLMTIVTVCVASGMLAAVCICSMQQVSTCT